MIRAWRGNPYNRIMGPGINPMHRARAVPLGLKVATSPGNVGDYFGAPSSDLSTITGDISVRWFGALDDWVPGFQQILCGKESAANTRSWKLVIGTSGGITLGASPDGTAEGPAFSGTLPSEIFTPGSFHGIRADRVADTGQTTFYYTVGNEFVWIEHAVDDGAAHDIFEAPTSEVSIMSVRLGNAFPAQGFCALCRVFADVNESELAVNFNPNDYDSGSSFVDDILGDVYSFNGGVSIVNFPPNVLPNSIWAGASGSVGGADWIPPTGWNNSFWPPDEAIAIGDISGDGDTGVQFIVAVDRGYLSVDVDTSLRIGQRFNLSIFIDETITTGAYANVSGGNVSVIRAFPNVSNGFVGRVDAVYEINGPTMGIRFGAGVTSNSTSDMTLSRPQLTIGEDLHEYQQT